MWLFQRGAVLLTAALLSHSLIAAETMTIELTFTPDLNNGRRVYETCAACHLPEGWGSSDGAYPQIAGQHPHVLLKQLLDIRNGHRENSVMYPFVQTRTIGGYQSLVDVVSYITRLPMHPRHKQGPYNDFSDEYKQGEKLYLQNCASCHGADGEGNDATKIPKLYGQHYPYALRQIGLIRKGRREVDPAMKAIVDHLGREELEMIINYVSWLKVPDGEKAPSLSWRNTDFY
jgi:cytochrome c553